MADNISPIGDAARRMTYAELGRVRGISALSAERLVRRKGWPRQRGNDGFVRVLVPVVEARKTSKRLSAPDTDMSSLTSALTVSPSSAVSAPDILSPGQEVAIRALETAVETLREQLNVANRRADTERTRAERLELRVAELMRPWWRRWFRW